jgi:hypothetical protein
MMSNSVIALKKILIVDSRRLVFPVANCFAVFDVHFAGRSDLDDINRITTHVGRLADLIVDEKSGIRQQVARANLLILSGKQIPQVAIDPTESVVADTWLELVSTQTRLTR